MDLVYSSLQDLAEAIQAGQQTATEVLNAHIDPIELHNDRVTALVTMSLDQAKEQAKAADEALAGGELWGPLHGAPFTLKDFFTVEGVLLTFGFRSLKDYVAE